MIHLEEDGVMVSFDVTSLFTSVPVEEAVRVIKEKLQEDHILQDRHYSFALDYICLTKPVMGGTLH